MKATGGKWLVNKIKDVCKPYETTSIIIKAPGFTIARLFPRFYTSLPQKTKENIEEMEANGELIATAVNAMKQGDEADPQAFANWLKDNIDDIKVIYENITRFVKQLNLPFAFTTSERSNFYDAAFLKASAINDKDPEAVVNQMDNMLDFVKLAAAKGDQTARILILKVQPDYYSAGTKE